MSCERNRARNCIHVSTYQLEASLILETRRSIDFIHLNLSYLLTITYDCKDWDKFFQDILFHLFVSSIPVLLTVVTICVMQLFIYIHMYKAVYSKLLGVKRISLLAISSHYLIYYRFDYKSFNNYNIDTSLTNYNIDNRIVRY